MSSALLPASASCRAGASYSGPCPIAFSKMVGLDVTPATRSFQASRRSSPEVTISREMVSSQTLWPWRARASIGELDSASIAAILATEDRLGGSAGVIRIVDRRRRGMGSKVDERDMWLGRQASEQQRLELVA